MLDVCSSHTCNQSIGHNLCNPHHWTPGRFKIVLMHGHTCKSLLNTLGRTVEQLAGCLAKQAKSQQSRSKYMTVSKRVFPFSRQWHQVTPIAPPTGCSIRPVPNRNLSETRILACFAKICSRENYQLYGTVPYSW